MAHSAPRRTPAILAETDAATLTRPAGADPEKRKRILASAIRVFGRRGFHEARIAEIAAAAKVAEGTVYLYFRNKEDLLGVVFDETMDGVLGDARAIRFSDETAAGRLTRLVDLHISFLASDRDLASVFQIELRRSARLVERFSRTKLVEYFRLQEGLLKEGIEKGELRPDLDPRLSVRILFGAADEILSEWLLSGEGFPAANGERLVGTLLTGFSAAKITKRRTSS
jgi:TetR/AcrR family fatty acid metabolism transcriptional regulator